MKARLGRSATQDAVEPNRKLAHADQECDQAGERLDQNVDGDEWLLRATCLLRVWSGRRFGQKGELNVHDVSD